VQALSQWWAGAAWPRFCRLARYPYVLGEAGAGPPAEGGAGAGPGPAGGGGAGLGAFARLARVHGLSSAGDALVAVALAGSIFFNISVREAQSKVALSLALTVAPFAVVGPLLGPALERARGGRRAVVASSAAGRAACALLMAFWSHSVLLFPVAFFTLVFSKLYLVAKAALVPSAVGRAEDLVLANSKLSIGGSLAGVLAGGLGAALFELAGPGPVLSFDVAVYLAAAWAATRLRPAMGQAGGRGAAVGPGQPAEPPAALVLPPGGVQLAAASTAGLRAVTGFVTFLLVFTFRRGGAELVWYGLALGASQVGNVAGALLAPLLRRRAREELMLTGASLFIGASALSAAVAHWGHYWGAGVVLAAGISVAAASGKVAFDSMVQRDVPSRRRGRYFARFESGFQLSWALGSLVAVLVPMSLVAGFGAAGVVGVLGALAFAGGSVKARRGTLPSWWPGAVPRPPSAAPPQLAPPRPGPSARAFRR